MVSINCFSGITYTVRRLRRAARAAQRSLLFRVPRCLLLLIVYGFLTHQIIEHIQKYQQILYASKSVYDPDSIYPPEFLYCPRNWADPQKLEMFNVSSSLLKYAESLFSSNLFSPDFSEIEQNNITHGEVRQMQLDFQHRVNDYANGSLDGFLESLSYSAKDMVKVRFQSSVLKSVPILKATAMGICVQVEWSWTNFTYWMDTTSWLHIYLRSNATSVDPDLLFCGYIGEQAALDPGYSNSIMIDSNSHYMIDLDHSHTSVQNNEFFPCEKMRLGNHSNSAAHFICKMKCKQRVCADTGGCVNYLPGDQYKVADICNPLYFRMSGIPMCHDMHDMQFMDDALFNCTNRSNCTRSCDESTFSMLTTLYRHRHKDETFSKLSIHRKYQPMSMLELYNPNDFLSTVSAIGGTMGLWRIIWWISGLGLVTAVSVCTAVALRLRGSAKQAVGKDQDAEMGLATIGRQRGDERGDPKPFTWY